MITNSVVSAVVLIAVIAAVTILVATGGIVPSVAAGVFGLVLGHVGTLNAVARSNIQ